MTDLNELLERVKAATGPDRELDFCIHIAAVEDTVWPVRDRFGRVTNPNYRMSDYLRDYASVINSDDQDFDFPRYTASIDAALALVERVLPGFSLRMATADATATERNPASKAAAELVPYLHNDDSWQVGIKSASGSTPPLAILAALLQALTNGATNV